MTYSPLWLRSFLGALFAAFFLLAVALWIYNVHKDHELLFAAASIQSDADDKLAGVLETFESPHLFAGYEVYHGFGPKRAPELFARVLAMVRRGTDYSTPEVDFLAHQVAYYLAALRELKCPSQNDQFEFRRHCVPFVPRDREILQTVADRWSSAVHAGYELAIHLTIVATILGLLLLVYVRKCLWERIGPLR